MRIIRTLLLILGSFTIAATALQAHAVTVVVAKFDNVNHAADSSAFFTLSTDGTTEFDPDGGWAPIAPVQAASATSTTPKKSFPIPGNSTAAGNWIDGNGIPAGITLAFDAEFTITALPLGSVLTNPGPNATVNNNIGRGIGVTQVHERTGRRRRQRRRRRARPGGVASELRTGNPAGGRRDSGADNGDALRRGAVDNGSRWPKAIVNVA